jgi:hypothetical protein
VHMRFAVSARSRGPLEPNGEISFFKEKESARKSERAQADLPPDNIERKRIGDRSHQQG